MPKKRYERRELSHIWEDIRPLLKDSSQITYEDIRPVVLFGVSPKERAEETGISKNSIYYKANFLDQAGMASLFPPMPPPDLPKQDKRALPPPIRQAIVDAHAEYPELSLHEIASICYVQFGRKPSPYTIQYILATGPQPSRTGRRYKRFAEIDNPVERRKTILKLHAGGGLQRILPAIWRQAARPSIRRSNDGRKNSLPGSQTNHMHARESERLISKRCKRSRSSRKIRSSVPTA